MFAAFLRRYRAWALILVTILAPVQSAAAVGPVSPRANHTAIYDPLRRRMVVFGGLNVGSIYNDTWQLSLDSAEWTPLTPADTVPPERARHSAVYDPVRDRMLVFGGLRFENGLKVLNDVWSLALSGTPIWTQLHPEGTSAPSRRFFHSAVYDSRRDRMLVFGGNDSSQYLSDVWSLWLGESTPRWEQLAVPTPSGMEREEHAAIYDPVRDRMIVFGGYPSKDDVWALSLGDSSTAPFWTKLTTPGVSPGELTEHSAIYDSPRDRMIVFGGIDGSGLRRNDVWQLALSSPPTWSAMARSEEAPNERSSHSAVYDSLHDRMVIFGGSPQSNGDVWALSLGPSMRWSPSGAQIELVPAELQFEPLTLGDTASVTFDVANWGMAPLQVKDIRLPVPGMRLSSPPPLKRLLWNQSVRETLFLTATEPHSAPDSIVFVSGDTIPDRQLSLGLLIHALDFETRVLGAAPRVPLGLAFDVVVTPEPGVHVERGALFYRIAGRSTFESVSLTPLSTDFLATVPAAAVRDSGVEYYVAVENGSFADTLPRGAPAVVYTQTVAPPTSMTAVPRPNSGVNFLTGREIPVDLDLPAGASFVAGLLHYRKGGEPDWRTDALASAGALGKPAAIIPDTVVGPRGIEYWVEATTLDTTLRFPAAQVLSRSIPIKVDSLAEDGQPHPGARYRLLSVPLDFGPDLSHSIYDVLVDQLFIYTPMRWRSYVFDAASQQNVELSLPASAAFGLEPGRGFWLITREPHRVDTKPIDGFSTPPGADYPIPLLKGWNLFGDPFDFPVAWAEVRHDSVEGPYAFDPSRDKIGGWITDRIPSVLMPFEGYYIYAAEAETLWIPPRAASPAMSTILHMEQPAARQSEGDDWLFRLSARTSEATDDFDEFGVRAGALEGFDPLDGRKLPPVPGPWVQVAFAHREWGERTGRYRRDVRGPGAAGETWEIEVRSSAPGEPVTLDLGAVDALPRGLAMSLIDREQGSALDWSAAARSSPGSSLNGAAGGAHAYRIVSLGDHPYRLAIVAGSQEYVAHAIEHGLAVPPRIVLDQSAPNPFRIAARIRFGLPRADDVSLEIYDVLGRRVAALLGRASMAPGYHTIVWDGKTASGSAAPDGVYLLRLAAGSEVLTRRLLRVR